MYSVNPLTINLYRSTTFIPLVPHPPNTDPKPDREDAEIGQETEKGGSGLINGDIIIFQHPPPPPTEGIMLEGSAGTEEAAAGGEKDGAFGFVPKHFKYIVVNHMNKTALLTMCQSEKTKPDMVKVQALIDGGIDVQYQDNQGRTALYFASGCDHTDTVQALLESDPSVEHVRVAAKNGVTALMYA